MLQQTHCHQVAVLDVRGLSPVTDFFVIASGSSARQMRSVGAEAIELGLERQFKALSRNDSGTETASWVLVDFVDVVLHLFNDQTRSYYDLDNLWGDARPVDFNLPAEPVAQASPVVVEDAASTKNRVVSKKTTKAKPPAKAKAAKAKPAKVKTAKAKPTKATPAKKAGSPAGKKLTRKKVPRK